MKKVLSIAVVAFILAALFIPVVSAASTRPLFDDAQLLDDNEVVEVQTALRNVTDKYGVEVSVVTLNDYTEVFGAGTIDDAAETFCKSGEYISKDCVVLMISMAGRDWCIASNQKGHDAFTAYGREYIGNAINEELHDGDYDDAFIHYSKLCDEFLAEAQKGTPYDNNHKLMTTTDYLIRFGIPLGAGIIIGIIAVLSVKSKYKPVRLKAEANDYLIQGSLQVHQQYDHFIYTHVTRTRRAKESSSSSHDSGSFGSTSGKF